MKRVLITGASGFIGAHVVAKLAMNFSYELFALDSFSDYYSPEYKRLRLESLANMNSEKIFTLDLANFADLEAIFDEVRPQSVIHLAAQAGVRLPLDRFNSYTESNLAGHANILTLSAKYQVEEVLYASSSSVYGNHAQVPYSESEKNLVPTSFYGSTKLCNEVMAEPFAEHYGLKVRGLRFFTVYGPWGRPDMAYFRILTSLLNTSSFELFGDGKVRRDFTFIDDAVDIVEKLLVNLSEQAPGFSDVVNVGGGNPYSILDVIKKLETISNKTIHLLKSPADKSDVVQTCSNSSYRDDLIGLHKFVDLDSGLKRFYHWGENPKIRNNLKHWVQSST